MRKPDPVSVAILFALAATTVAVDRWLGRAEYVYPGGKARIVRGTVLRKIPDTSAWDALGRRQRREILQRLTVETAAGTVEADNIITGSPVNDRIPDVGEEVLVRIRDLGSGRYAVLREYGRDRWLVRLAGLVGIVVVLVFGWKGGRALGALLVSLLLVLALLAAIASLRSAILPLTLAVIMLALGSTYVILCGPTCKALGAMGGAFAGITLSGLLALAVTRLSGLSGLHDQDLAAIYHFTTARAMDFRALLVAGMLLGTVGAVMDVAIAVASATSELHRAAPELDLGALRSRGMAVGRKVMGAMVMALALAYAGVNFGLFLLPHAEPDTSLFEVLGTERLVGEVLRLLVGVTAIVWTVPATAYLAAWLESRRTRERRSSSGEPGGPAALAGE